MDIYERELEARNTQAGFAAQAAPIAQPYRSIKPEEPGRSVSPRRPPARSRSKLEVTHQSVSDRLGNRVAPTGPDKKIEARDRERDEQKPRDRQLLLRSESSPPLAVTATRHHHLDQRSPASPISQTTAADSLERLAVASCLPLPEGWTNRTTVTATPTTSP
nr:hypothetical protein Iba_chr09aCG12470 [Ipomoea batatas]